MPFFETQKNKQTNAAVVLPQLVDSAVNTAPQTRLEEACGLALAINLCVVHQEILKLRQIKPATFFSNAFIEKMRALAEEKQIELLIVDTKLTPVQQRNIEKALHMKVIDRTALILEIFGERAKTREGILQVELAHLTYQRSRLVRSWTHLERQRGGAGFLGGPGETQIELDRRIIDDKITRLKKDLEKVKKTRGLQRTSRKKVPYPIVALVGYTNAGKSMLFNKISGEKVFSENLLFATLDPTLRRIKLPSGTEIILSDTVGFISDLPHELIMSFRATLEEVLEADVILHVRDIANENSKQQRQEVLSVLNNLGLEHIDSKENYLEVLNKTDLLSAENLSSLQSRYAASENVALVSALTGFGIENLLQKIDTALSKSHQTLSLKIPASNGALISYIYQNTEVISSENIDNYISFSVRAPAPVIAKIEKMNM